MIKKKYLTEVTFKNGVDEFKSYRTFTKTFTVDTLEDSITSYQLELDNEDIDEESLTVEIKDRYDVGVYWRKINGGTANLIEIYTLDGSSIVNGEVLELSYIALNNYSSDLYSVDYDSGTLYLANKNNIDLKCTCQFYNLFLTAKAAEQLDTTEYSVTGSVVSLNNHIDTYKYSSIYSLENSGSPEYTTPFIRNVKVNFINTSEEESF